MAIYWTTLLFVVVLAIGVIAAVALAAIGGRSADRTGLSIALRNLMAHLNGDAAPPPPVAELLGPVVQHAERRPAVGSDQPVTGASVPGASAGVETSGVSARKLGRVPADQSCDRGLAA